MSKKDSCQGQELYETFLQQTLNDFLRASFLINPSQQIVEQNILAVVAHGGMLRQPEVNNVELGLARNFVLTLFSFMQHEESEQSSPEDLKSMVPRTSIAWAS